MAKILLVDDDVELCRLVSEFLEGEGWEVAAVHDGEGGIERIFGETWDLVILDFMLPGCNGLDVLRRIRERTSVPVVMLTARGDEVDRIVGLELGADDYLPKPFNPRELAARMRAVMRRTGTDRDSGVERLTAGDLVLDTGARSVRKDGATIDLTGAEYELLEILLERAGSVVSREELSKRALGRRPSAFDRSLDTHLSNLRKKLGPFIGGRERLKTIRGVGYQYVKPSTEGPGDSQL
ncbi:MAG: DNA-binding response regulator [Acidobacteria bacterium]|nr:MAG: DNA-binding response regulator [Acidobacteriota bacterium]RLE27391.1 MAG: DNA-binding response regulator [Acidobacteriota bacterium]